MFLLEVLYKIAFFLAMMHRRLFQIKSNCNDYQLLVKFRQIFINIGETPKSIQFKQHPRANGAVQRDQIENSGNFASAE